MAMLIVDQRMPDLTGTELLARSMVTQPDAIRILLTGYMDLDTLVEAINAELLDFAPEHIADPKKAVSRIRHP